MNNIISELYKPTNCHGLGYSWNLSRASEFHGTLNVFEKKIYTINATKIVYKTSSIYLRSSE